MNGKLNMMKGAIETATRVSTVSPSYAAEIKDPWFSWGLHDELNLRHYKLCGIKNGIDTESVKEKAVERGLVTPEAAEQLSQKEIIDFLIIQRTI